MTQFRSPYERDKIGISLGKSPVLYCWLSLGRRHQVELRTSVWYVHWSYVRRWEHYLIVVITSAVAMQKVISSSSIGRMWASKDEMPFVMNVIWFWTIQVS